MKQKRTCCVCSSVLVGKKSQRYCTKECQNTYDKIKVHFLRKVLKNTKLNKRIKRNYVILNGVFSTCGKKVHIHLNNLFEHGFDINAYIKVKNNNRVFVIAEFEFKLLRNNVVEITRTRKSPAYPIEFIRRWAFEFDTAKSLLRGKKLYLIQSLFRVITIYDIPISVAKLSLQKTYNLKWHPPS